MAADRKEVLTKFLNSRRNERTKQYTQTILQCLSHKGWMRSHELFGAVNRKLPPDSVRIRDLPHGSIPESTFHKLLDDLIEANIIKKKIGARSVGVGRSPVYYRSPKEYSDLWFMSRDELIRKNEVLINLYHKSRTESMALFSLLRRYTGYIQNFDIGAEIDRELSRYHIKDNPRYQPKFNLNDLMIECGVGEEEDQT